MRHDPHNQEFRATRWNGTVQIPLAPAERPLSDSSAPAEGGTTAEAVMALRNGKIRAALDLVSAHDPAKVGIESTMVRAIARSVLGHSATVRSELELIAEPAKLAATPELVGPYLMALSYCNSRQFLSVCAKVPAALRGASSIELVLQTLASISDPAPLERLMNRMATSIPSGMLDALIRESASIRNSRDFGPRRSSDPRTQGILDRARAASRGFEQSILAEIGDINQLALDKDNTRRVATAFELILPDRRASLTISNKFWSFVARVLDHDIDAGRELLERRFPVLGDDTKFAFLAGIYVRRVLDADRSGGKRVNETVLSFCRKLAEHDKPLALGVLKNCVFAFPEAVGRISNSLDLSSHRPFVPPTPTPAEVDRVYRFLKKRTPPPSAST